MAPTNNHINYIEFKSNDLKETKNFYSNCFDWKFTDYGPNYTSFENSGLAGGFEFTNEKIKHGVLVVLVHQDLLKVKSKIKQYGGTISKDIFSFPGGERFQFLDPSGNELAVWREV
jgi:predicted enzyme related to lactoylglutathione lyase